MATINTVSGRLAVLMLPSVAHSDLSAENATSLRVGFRVLPGDKVDLSANMHSYVFVRTPTGFVQFGPLSDYVRHSESRKVAMFRKDQRPELPAVIEVGTLLPADYSGSVEEIVVVPVRDIGGVTIQDAFGLIAEGAVSSLAADVVDTPEIVAIRRSNISALATNRTPISLGTQLLRGRLVVVEPKDRHAVGVMHVSGRRVAAAHTVATGDSLRYVRSEEVPEYEIRGGDVVVAITSAQIAHALSRGHRILLWTDNGLTTIGDTGVRSELSLRGTNKTVTIVQRLDVLPPKIAVGQAVTLLETVTRAVIMASGPLSREGVIESMQLASFEFGDVRGNPEASAMREAKLAIAAGFRAGLEAPPMEPQGAIGR